MLENIEYNFKDVKEDEVLTIIQHYMTKGILGIYYSSETQRLSIKLKG